MSSKAEGSKANTGSDKGNTESYKYKLCSCYHPLDRKGSIHSNKYLITKNITCSQNFKIVEGPHNHGAYGCLDCTDKFWSNPGCKCHTTPGIK
jgi:hypothetical protein